MALGIALMFGIVLPQNFDAPYRAASLRDFWRRWHMTLSRFLRDYLYIPLGGNRHGLPRQVGALFATMALGGLWHGAGLPFLAWGAVHGLGLGAGLLARRAGLALPAALGAVFTFTFVLLTWVLFRAPSLEAALYVYKAMLGFAPWGGEVKWRAIAIAAAVATIGPTAWTLVHRLPPRRSLAVATAVLFVASSSRSATTPTSSSSTSSSEAWNVRIRTGFEALDRGSRAARGDIAPGADHPRCGRDVRRLYGTQFAPHTGQPTRVRATHGEGDTGGRLCPV